MTSEVCVMNGRAIVLAADSAVTVTRWEGGQKEERYFKGANKIFQLHNTRPIGLMIFDTADLQRVPWELLVKEFRSRIGSRSCGALSDYIREFFEFIKSYKAAFPDKYLFDVFRENAGHVIVRHLIMAQEDDSVKAHPERSDEHTTAFSLVLESMHKYLQSISVKVPLTDASMDATKAAHLGDLRSTAEEYLKIFGVDEKFSAEKLAEIGIEALFKAPELFTTNTGIVIGGYADDSIFPSYEEYTCAGFIGDEIYWKCSDGYQVSAYDQGVVKAFATTAMVNTFTLGFAPDVYTAVRDSLASTLLGVAAKISENTGSPVPGIDEILRRAAIEHEEGWTRAVFDRHAAPLRRVVGALPVDEMASLAETLIELESLKEKVTQPSESVGGPIDVAVISKSEGFVWIKRKHYFDSRLNPRFGLRQQIDFQGHAEAENG